MCNYNDELLIACLTLLVNVPVIIWTDREDTLYDLHTTKSLLYVKMAIELGTSYLPLGYACLDMLEQWITGDNWTSTFLNTISRSYVALPAMESWINAIMPSFRPMLPNTDSLSTEEDDVYKKQLTGLVSSKGDNRNLARTLRFIQELEHRRLSEEVGCEINDSRSRHKLENLQNRLTIILGMMGINHSRYFVSRLF